MPTSLTGRLKALDTCAVSDALDFLGITGATTGIHSMWGRQKIAGRARTVVHDDLFSKPCAQLSRDRAGDNIAAATRGKRNDQPYRFRGILLRSRRGDAGYQQAGHRK